MKCFLNPQATREHDTPTRAFPLHTNRPRLCHLVYHWHEIVINTPDGTSPIHRHTVTLPSSLLVALGPKSTELPLWIGGPLPRSAYEL